MEYCCHIWGGSSNNSLGLLDRIQKRIMNLIGPIHRIHGMCSNELKSLRPGIKIFNRETRMATNAHAKTVRVPNCNRQFYASSFFPQTLACFPESYDLQKFKSNVNRYLHSSSCL